MARTGPRTYVADGMGRSATMRGGNGRVTRRGRATAAPGRVRRVGLPARRRSMVTLGTMVLTASWLGAVVGHLLAVAPA
jgi:hypothetical protein